MEDSFMDIFEDLKIAILKAQYSDFFIKSGIKERSLVASLSVLKVEIRKVEGQFILIWVLSETKTFVCSITKNYINFSDTRTATLDKFGLHIHENKRDLDPLVQYKINEGVNRIKSFLKFYDRNAEKYFK